MDLHPIYLNNFGGGEGPYAVSGRIGSPGLPVFAHVATPVGQELGYTIDATVTGPVCGECTSGWSTAFGAPVRHASVAHIRVCSAINRHIEWQEAAEAPLARAGIL